MCIRDRISSTAYLEPLLARPGVLTARAPNAEEQQDLAYGRAVAGALAGYDIGQTVVVEMCIRDSSCRSERRMISAAPFCR